MCSLGHCFGVPACHQPEWLVYQLRAGCAICLGNIVRLIYKYQRNSLLIEHSDNAGVLGITVASDKTLIGSGTSGIIKGKGLRIVSGASNIIIQ